MPTAAELPIVDGKRVVHNKEVFMEQLKHEMGLHNDEGNTHVGLYMQNGLPDVAEDSCFISSSLE